MNISNAVLNIKIEDIVPNRFQPREHFADDGIEELDLNKEKDDFER